MENTEGLGFFVCLVGGGEHFLPRGLPFEIGLGSVRRAIFEFFTK